VRAAAGREGLSERIRVRSIVGRFLEHSRIFSFANGGEPEVFCGSADWMPRNLFERCEVVFPVNDPALARRLRDEILAAYLADNVPRRGCSSRMAATCARPRRGRFSMLRSTLWRYRRLRAHANE
jgi:polyphosphate kinase